MTDDTKALVARLRTSHGQIVHEFYSKDGKLYCDCAICDAADLIERQSKALRAMAELCDEYEATYDLRPALDALERGNGEEEDMAADYVMLAEIVRVLRAALAQTEPQTDDGEPYVSLTGTALQRFKENPLRYDSK